MRVNRLLPILMQLSGCVMFLSGLLAIYKEHQVGQGLIAAMGMAYFRWGHANYGKPDFRFMGRTYNCPK